jgi:hypothetical protein
VVLCCCPYPFADVALHARLMCSDVVIPVDVGIQLRLHVLEIKVDSGFRRNDGWRFPMRLPSTQIYAYARLPTPPHAQSPLRRPELFGS